MTLDAPSLDAPLDAVPAPVLDSAATSPIRKAARRPDAAVALAAPDPVIESPSLPASDSEPVITLDEFCQQKSLTDRRVTLLGGFYYAMQRAGRNAGTFTEFRAALAAFAGATPV